MTSFQCFHVVTRDLGFSLDLKRKCSMLIRAEGCCDSFGAHNGGLMRSGNLKSIKHNSECQAEYDESGSDRICPLGKCLNNRSEVQVHAENPAFESLISE